MKKILKLGSIIMILLMTLSSLAFAIEPSLSLSVVCDTRSQILLINGVLNTGPEHLISLVLVDGNENLVYPESAKTVAGGEFSASMGVEGLANGSYTLQVRSDDGAFASETVTLPNDSGEQPIQAQIGEEYLMMKDGVSFNEEFNTITLSVKNARIREGVIPQEDIAVSGLAQGLTYGAQGLSQNRIVVTFGGQATQTVEENQQISFVLSSRLISGGEANTYSDPIGPVTIYPAQWSQKIQWKEGDATQSITMKNKRQINTSQATFTRTVLVHSLKKDGALEKGVDFDYTMPQELSGFTISAQASIATGTVQFRISGIAENDVNASQSVSIILKKELVESVSEDSNPIVVEFIPATSSGGGSGAGSGGGSSGGGGSSSSGGGASITGGATHVDVNPIIPEVIKTFDDIQSHWAKADIESLAGKGIVRGDSDFEFAPDRTVTRAEFVTMIVRAMGLETVAYSGSFQDVGEDDWYAMTIEAALRSGIITQDDSFRPNAFITREEMTKMTVSAWLLSHENPQWISRATSLSDYEQISEWAKEYVDLAFTLGLVKGNDQNEFLPLDNATRAEAAAMTNRLLANLV